MTRLTLSALFLTFGCTDGPNTLPPAPEAVCPEGFFASSSVNFQITELRVNGQRYPFVLNVGTLVDRQEAVCISDDETALILRLESNNDIAELRLELPAAGGDYLLGEDEEFAQTLSVFLDSPQLLSIGASDWTGGQLSYFPQTGGGFEVTSTSGLRVWPDSQQVSYSSYVLTYSP